MQNISINIEKKEFLNYENKIKPHIAIKNFNLEIAKGQFCSIIGPSGCGKTTLLKLIAGLDKAYTGSISFGKNKAVYNLNKALSIARDQELDLVEISPNASPPVCKILEYKKFLYEQKKREKLLKSKTIKVILKEIRFGPNTDEHDYEFKKKHAEKFLLDGAKLKAFVFFKGRSIVYKEKGQILLLRLAQDLEEYGKVEQMPTLEGKKMSILITPKKISKK